MPAYVKCRTPDFKTATIAKAPNLKEAAKLCNEFKAACPENWFYIVRIPGADWVDDEKE